MIELLIVIVCVTAYFLLRKPPGRQKIVQHGFSWKIGIPAWLKNTSYRKSTLWIPTGALVVVLMAEAYLFKDWPWWNYPKGALVSAIGLWLIVYFFVLGKNEYAKWMLWGAVVIMGIFALPFLTEWVSAPHQLPQQSEELVANLSLVALWKKYQTLVWVLFLPIIAGLLDWRWKNSKGSGVATTLLAIGVGCIIVNPGIVREVTGQIPLKEYYEEARTLHWAVQIVLAYMILMALYHLIFGRILSWFFNSEELGNARPQSITLLVLIITVISAQVGFSIKTLSFEKKTQQTSTENNKPMGAQGAKNELFM